MTYNKQQPKLDPEMIIMGLGYATSLLVAIGWVATLVLCLWTDSERWIGRSERPFKRLQERWRDRPLSPKEVIQLLLESPK